LNPIVQNLRHVQTLNSLLEANGIICDDILSVVVVNNENRDINSITPVLSPNEMVEYIEWSKSTREFSAKDISDIIEIIFPDYRIQPK